MDIPTYAPQAIDRWTVTESLGKPGSVRADGNHDPRTCGCLVCSDGRAALGMAPLVPLFARRAVRAYHAGRWRR